jgi:hypothetical protein
MYTHTKTDKYHKIEYNTDGVSRAVFLPLSTPLSEVRNYFNRKSQAKAEQPAPASGSLDAAIATA